MICRSYGTLKDRKYYYHEYSTKFSGRIVYHRDKPPPRNKRPGAYYNGKANENFWGALYLGGPTNRKIQSELKKNSVNLDPKTFRIFSVQFTKRDYKFQIKAKLQILHITIH